MSGEDNLSGQPAHSLYYCYTCMAHPRVLRYHCVCGHTGYCVNPKWRICTNDKLSVRCKECKDELQQNAHVVCNDCANIILAVQYRAGRGHGRVYF
jgi:hypothetical protein